MGTIIGKGDNPTYRDLSREIQAALRQLQDQERKRHFVQAVLEHAAGHGGQSMQSQMHIDTLQYIYIYICTYVHVCLLPYIHLYDIQFDRYLSLKSFVH